MLINHLQKRLISCFGLQSKIRDVITCQRLNMFEWRLHWDCRCIPGIERGGKKWKHTKKLSLTEWRHASAEWGSRVLTFIMKRFPKLRLNCKQNKVYQDIAKKNEKTAWLVFFFLPFSTEQRISRFFPINVPKNPVVKVCPIKHTIAPEASWCFTVGGVVWGLGAVSGKQLPDW